MSLHNHPLFESRTDIPDLVPPELLLPEDSAVRVIQAKTHTASTTTPVEVGFCFYELGVGGFVAERALLDIYEDEGGVPNNFLANGWGNHLGRVMLKTMLDPDRQAPVDLVLAYRSESKFRGYSENEEAFFVGFTENWGVVANRE